MENIHSCLNCEKSLPEKAKFCPHCGQKNNNGKIKMSELLRRFWTHFSHLDSKFIRAVWELMIPGRVTKIYFSGKQKRYPHPVQFFFIVMFFFLLLFNRSMGSKGLQFNNMGDNFSFNFKSKTKTDTSSLEPNELIETLNFNAKINKLNLAYRNLPKPQKDSISLPLIHQLVAKVFPREMHLLRKFKGLQDSLQALGADSIQQQDSIRLNLMSYSHKFAVQDIFEYNTDELLAMQNVTNWFDKILFRQSIKSFKDPAGLVHHYIGSFAWTILALIAFMAAVLTLFYRNQKRYYVEHFVFLMHQHSASYLMITFALILSSFLHLGGWWFILFLWIDVFLLLGMHHYYEQSWKWTILKWMAYNMLYVMLFLFLFAIGLLVSLILF